MPFHPAHPLFVLLESIDLNNEDHLIHFAKENQKFQLQIQDGLLHAYINRLPIKEGKLPEKVLEIREDDAISFRIALILDYLSVLSIEKAQAYCQKTLKILEKLDSALAPQSKKDGVIESQEKKGLTDLVLAFDAAKKYGFKTSDTKDLEEAFVTIHDAEINASKENLFKRILSVDPSNNLAVVDFFQRAEQDLVNAKQRALGDAITGLDEQLPVLIAFSTGIALEENIDSEKMQVILDKLMLISESFLETIRGLPDGEMQDKLKEQHAWCFNLSSALIYVIEKNSTVEVLSDTQTFEYFSRLHENKLRVAIQLNALIRDTQKKLNKEVDPKQRLNYQKEIDDKINQFKELVGQNSEVVKKQDSAGHNILYYVVKESPTPAIVEFLINNGCDVSQMGVAKTDIEAEYLVDKKGNSIQFLGYDGEEREITLNERLLQLKNYPAFDIYRIQKILPQVDSLINRNDVDGLRKLFSTFARSGGINPNLSVNARGDTLMHLACRSSHPEMIKFFLEHEFGKGREIKFNIQNADGLRSFDLIDDKSSIQAIKQEMKYIYTAEQLLNCIEQKTFDEFVTELQTAIDNGFELNGQYGFNGESLLHLCIESSRGIGEEKLEALFKHLQDKGADFNVRNKKGETPLFKAAQTPSFSLVIFKKLIEQYHADPDALSKRNDSILTSAVGVGRPNSEISIFLLDRYEKSGGLYVTEEGESTSYISLPDNHGLTAMHYAIERNDTKVINKLLEQNFDLTLDLENWIVYEDIKEGDIIGYGLLHWAAEKCSAEIFEKILNKYKDQLEVQFIHQNLHLSADDRKQRFEAFFIEKINDLDGQIGLTLLHAALKNNDSEKIIDILKQNGSRLTEENTATGQSYMARAMIPFSKAIVTSQPFDVAAKLISPEMLAMHFSNHARTPLMMVLDNLIGKVDVKVKDNKVAQAELKKSKNTFPLLIPSNIAVNTQLLSHIMSMTTNESLFKKEVRDATGNTALHYSMRILSISLTEEQLKPVLQVIERSLKENVSLNIENTDGKSPLDLLVEVATGHFKHDIMPKKLFDELERAGDIDLEAPQFEKYNIRSFTEPFVILSEHRETTLLTEVLNKKKPDNYLSFLQLVLMRDPDLRNNIADSLLTPDASGNTVLGNLFKNPTSNPAAIDFALQCVDLKDKRFANVVCDQIPIDSPYLDLGNEKFLKKWLNEGLNINHQGEKTGNTLLHKRFQQGDSADVATLLRQGANPKLKNNEGHTARASKSEHTISIPVIINYGIKYAEKTLNNGVKRLWNGLTGKKESLPTPLVPETNHVDDKGVMPLEKSESVVVPKMQQKTSVRFLGDSVELVEKKPLPLIKNDLPHSNMSDEQRVQALLQAGSPKDMIHNIVRILYEKDVPQEQRQANMMNAFDTMEIMIKLDHGLAQFQSLDQQGSELNVLYQGLLARVEEEMGSVVKAACAEFVQEGMQQARQAIIQKEAEAAQEFEAQKKASRDPVITAIIAGTATLKHNDLDKLPVEQRGIFLLQQSNPKEVLDLIKNYLEGEHSAEQKQQFVVAAFNTLDIMIKQDAGQIHFKDLNQAGTALNQSYKDLLDTVRAKVSKNASAMCESLVQDSVEQARKMTNIAENLKNPKLIDSVGAINIQSFLSENPSVRQMTAVADAMAQDLMNANKVLIAQANVNLYKGVGGPTTDAMQSLTKAFNQIPNLMSQQILAATSDKERQKLVALYILTAQKSAEKGDYATAFAINSAFAMAHIDRLKIVEQLPAKIKVIKDDLDALLDPGKNFKNLRVFERNEGIIFPSAVVANSLATVGEVDVWDGAEFNPQRNVIYAQALLNMVNARTSVLTVNDSSIFQQRTNIVSKMVSTPMMDEKDLYDLSLQIKPRAGQQSAPPHLGVKAPEVEAEKKITFAELPPKPDSAPDPSSEPVQVAKKEAPVLPPRDDWSKAKKAPDPIRKGIVPPLDVSNVNRSSDYERRGVPMPPLDLSKLRNPDSPPLPPPVTPIIAQQAKPIVTSSSSPAEKKPEPEQMALKNPRVKALISMFETKKSESNQATAVVKQPKVEDDKPSEAHKVKPHKL